MLKIILHTDIILHAMLCYILHPYSTCYWCCVSNRTSPHACAQAPVETHPPATAPPAHVPEVASVLAADAPELLALLQAEEDGVQGVPVLAVGEWDPAAGRLQARGINCMQCGDVFDVIDGCVLVHKWSRGA